jgi:hypothetical protein
MVRQGTYFYADEMKLNAIIEACKAKTQCASDDVIGTLIDYDWPNAYDHQEWINTADIDEIVDWLLTIM